MVDKPASNDSRAQLRYRSAASWGTHGSGEGEFNYPVAVAIDREGNILVAENNHRVQKFDPTGAFIATWGCQGRADGEFEFPCGIATDAAGNVYVADSENHRVQKFDSAETFLAKWGSEGDGDGQFDTPCGIATDAAGNVYVADKFNQRIQKFDPEGGFVAKWGHAGHRDSWGGWVAERDEGKFDYQEDVATDTAGNVYVVDSNNHRIQKFDSTGAFLLMWGEGVDDGGAGLQVCTSGCRAGISGHEAHFAPTHVAIDAHGNVYVVDTGRIQQVIKKFDSAGGFITGWGEGGPAPEQLSHPQGIAVDSEGNVYVADYYNHRIQKFSPAAGWP